MSLLYHSVSNIIETTKEKVYHTVNFELVFLYWNIGKTIKEVILKSEKANYGETIIHALAKELSERYGKGYGN